MDTKEDKKVTIVFNISKGKIESMSPCENEDLEEEIYTVDVEGKEMYISREMGEYLRKHTDCGIMGMS
tara:strand:+ start:874 stop:1077 length:204 start_codon:yes stop_codon:yes gene_type:complete